MTRLLGWLAALLVCPSPFLLRFLPPTSLESGGPGVLRTEEAVSAPVAATPVHHSPAERVIQGHRHLLPARLTGTLQCGFLDKNVLRNCLSSARQEQRPWKCHVAGRSSLKPLENLSLALISSSWRLGTDSLGKMLTPWRTVP